jgi:hypothetical protein
VQGEAGHGKSALLAQLAQELSSSYAWTSCRPQSGADGQDADCDGTLFDSPRRTHGDMLASPNYHGKGMSLDMEYRAMLGMDHADREASTVGQRVRTALIEQHSLCLCVWFCRQIHHSYADALHILAKEVCSFISFACELE